MLTCSHQHIRRLPHHLFHFIIHTPVSVCLLSKCIRGTVKSVIGLILKFDLRYCVLAAKLSGDCTCVIFLLPPETHHVVSAFHLSRLFDVISLTLVYCSVMGRIKFLPPPAPYIYCLISDSYWRNSSGDSLSPVFRRVRKFAKSDY
jgi:hypothetical protein